MISIVEIGNSHVQIANPAHIREIILIKRIDVLKIMNPSVVKPNGSYIFEKDMFLISPTAELYKIDFVYRSCVWTEDSLYNTLRSYNTNINFEVASVTSDFDKWLIDNERHEFVSFFGTRDGKIYFVGDIDTGLELSYKKQTAPKKSTFVSLANNLPNQAWQIDYDGEDLMNFFGEFEFSNDFGEEFTL